MPADKRKSIAGAGGDKKDEKPKVKGKEDAPKGKGAKEEHVKKGKEDPKGKKEEHAKGKGGKEEPAKVKKGKDEAIAAKSKADMKGGKKGKKEEAHSPEPEVIPLTPSQAALEEAEYRAMVRKQRFKRHWPSITKVKVVTKPWYPPGPPQKMPRIEIELPELTMHRWVPPFRRRRRRRPKLPRILPEPQPPYESSKLKKIWHGFAQVDANKMLLQGSYGCNSKRYSSTACGSQTACIGVVCRALLDEKTPAQLVKRDVDEVIEGGDRFYRQCMLALKCYKGKPQLQLNQLLSSFFFHDTKYTVKLQEMERGLLAKHPDVVQKENDLMAIMEKRQGSTYMMLLTLGNTKHFLIWGHPPSPESGSQVKTVCYIFDPHMLNDQGQPNKLPEGCCPGKYGGGGFIRYPGVSSFVIDFLANYGKLDAAKKGAPTPHITLSSVEIVQKEPLLREPFYELDLNALKPHCRSEWDSMNMNKLIDQKRFHGKYPQCSLSAVSLATSRATSRKKVRDFYQKSKPPPPQPPVQVEKGPPPLTNEQIMQMRGEDFFLYCPRTDAHTFGRDDLIPLPKSETVLHSPVDVADHNYHSQFTQLDVEKWILRGTRHFASYRYQIFKSYTGVACCVSALGMLRRLRARGWNEDVLDETLDLGYNLFRESLVERQGPIRRLVLGELKETFWIRDREYKHKERGIAVWGKLLSSDPKVLDLCRGIEQFFRESDGGILMIPGEYETAIFNEGGKYYIYHPWPADRYGTRVSLQGGGKACILYFTRVTRLCEYFMENVSNMRRKPFSIADVGVYEVGERPEPFNKMKPVDKNRWIVRGSFHEGNDRFPEDHRNKQATPTAITAIAMATIIDPAEWTPADIDETLIRGDILYESTMEHLEKLGISFETPRIEETADEEEQEMGQGPTGTLAAADVLPRFRVSEYDCIETDVLDSAYSGQLNPEPGTGVLSLKDSLKSLFKEHKAGVVTARGGSTAVWFHDDHLYFFDPHGCDENGLPSEDARAGACLVRLKNNVSELADVIMGNLTPGADDSFNISPVEIIATKLNAEIGAPETKIESRAYQWLNRGTAAIMMGPRGENSGIGKAVERAAVPKDDLAGRLLALPAAAAFCASSNTVPPPHMHQDHMFNFLDAGAEYYLNHVKKTGRKNLEVEDLSEKFEMGANTFSIELGEPTRLPLRLPDVSAEGGEEAAEKELGVEGEEEVPKDEIKQIKDLLFKMWYDTTKPTSISLLVGDYHQMGVWMAAGGKVVAFDPAPTLTKGLLTPQRIAKGNELRLQRLKDEMTGEGAGEEDEDDEEAGGEGEEKPEPEPEVVPPESCPVLITAASPGEFIDKLTQRGGLDPKQCIAPYKLYPVTVTNELTSVLKDKRPGAKVETEEGDEGAEPEDSLVDLLDDAVIGKYFTRMGRSVASVRGRVAQNENYFMDNPNRDHQDAANAIMGIVVDHIEPYTYWKPQLIDGILKYGDRLYTMSLPEAAAAPKLVPDEILKEFHVTNFNVKLAVEGNVVVGDIKAGDSGGVLSLAKGIKKFFETHKYGVLCAKDYCVGLWKASDDKALCYWDPHPTGPVGRTSPGGAAALVLFSNVEQLAETYKSNVDQLARPGTNKFSIAAVTVAWEFSKLTGPVTPQGALPDESYEWKVLTGYVETARGRTILRGTRPPDLHKFARDSLLQTAASAIVAACLSHVRRPHLWTHKTVDEVLCVGCQLFIASLNSLGYEFRPGEDVLLPLQVLKRFVLGVNYVRYDLESVFSGKLEQMGSTEMTVRCALERFFESHTHGILWSVPHAVAVWRVAGAPSYYMMEPHACGPTGLRIDAQDDGAACVLTFTSPKLMAFAYLQNIPVLERPKHEFHLYAMSVIVQPIKKLGKVEPPLVRAPPGAALVPATSKVGIDGQKRRAAEGDRAHPPGSTTCIESQRATEVRDKEENTKFKGERNNSGWLVLNDGCQFMSAGHSIACHKFPHGSRGNQALSCSVMAVAMSRVEDVCRWCSTTLDQILQSGDQLYQDSYLHFRPRGTKLLTIQQILRKFYTPGNCVCRLVVYQARQAGTVDTNLIDQLTEFFREEKAGVFVAGYGDFAVALFRTPRGYYMFDPSDRDRYGRAVAPPCIGRARACFSQYPSVQALGETLGPNVPPIIREIPRDTKDVQAPGETLGPKIPSDIEKIKTPRGSKDVQALGEALGPKIPSDIEKIKTPRGSKDVQALNEALGPKIPSDIEKIKTPRGSKDVQVLSSPVKNVSEHKEESVHVPVGPGKDASGNKEKSVTIIDDREMVRIQEPAPFTIYGMGVTSLRKLNRHER